MKIWAVRWDRSTLGEPARVEQVSFHPSESEALAFCKGWDAGQRSAAPEAPLSFLHTVGTPYRVEVTVSNPEHYQDLEDLARKLQLERYAVLALSDPQWSTFSVQLCK